MVNISRYNPHKHLFRVLSSFKCTVLILGPGSLRTNILEDHLRRNTTSSPFLLVLCSGKCYSIDLDLHRHFQRKIAQVSSIQQVPDMIR